MPPEEFWVSLANRLPTWFFNVAAVMLLFGLYLVLRWMNLGAKRLSDAMGRENRIYLLQEELAKEREVSRTSSAAAAQLAAALAGATSHVSSLNRLRWESQGDPNAPTAVVKQIIETLALDIKHRSGERHRCGLWIEEDGELILGFASAGFPDHYIGERRLSVNKSLAGRAYRLGRSKRWDDCRAEEEWEPNPDSNSSYASLVCIPLKHGTDVIGVVTIDGLNPMTDEDMAIGELYTGLIENAGYELTRQGIIETGRGGEA